MHTENETQGKIEISKGQFDRLSLTQQIRLDLAKGKKEFTYTIIRKGEFKKYHYRVIGNEAIVIGENTYNSLLVERMTKDSSKKTSIWFALDWDLVILKMETFEKNSKRTLVLDQGKLNGNSIVPLKKYGRDLSMASQKSGSSKLLIASGSLVAVALIFGVLYKTGNLSKQDNFELMGVIPEQVIVENTATETETPTAEIPQTQTTSIQSKSNTNDSSEQPTPEEVAKPKAPTLPSLDASDSLVRELVKEKQSSEGLNDWLKLDDLIRRSASFMDGLARGSVSEKIFPLGSPEGSFTTHRQDNVIWLNAGNYERYNDVVSILLSIDMPLMAQFFHRVRPLLETAFAELGYRPRQMDGIILQTIDNILTTPVIVEPLKLTRDSVAYKFADPELESLMPLQKQLLRAGPENTRRIQQQAKALREALLNPN